MKRVGIGGRKSRRLYADVIGRNALLSELESRITRISRSIIGLVLGFASRNPWRLGLMRKFSVEPSQSIHPSIHRRMEVVEVHVLTDIRFLFLFLFLASSPPSSQSVPLS